MNEHDREILVARAQAWNECVRWFADHVPEEILAEAEERNPYDVAITAPLDRDDS